MPVAEVEGRGDARVLRIKDQRFGDPRVRDRFTASISWKASGE
jgi:hypothetical protein